MKIGIIEPEGFSKKAENLLSAIGGVEKFSTSDSLASFVLDKEVIFIRLKYFWDKKLLKNAPKLKYICTPTTGLNHLDLKFLEEKAIEVISLKGETEFLSKNIRATPEHTFGLVLALLRNYNKAFLSSNNKKWNRDLYKGREIFGKHFGIIGLGRVGKIVAGYLHSFGANVYYFDKDKAVHSRIAKRCSSILKTIAACDVVMLCASYNEKNKAMIDKSCIDQMKGKYFINTARGELADENYLIKKIRQGHFRGVALDVITGENHSNNLPELLSLVSKENLIITPHIAGATFESMAKTEEFVAGKLLKKIRKNHE